MQCHSLSLDCSLVTIIASLCTARLWIVGTYHSACLGFIEAQVHETVLRRTGPGSVPRQATWDLWWTGLRGDCLSPSRLVFLWHSLFHKYPYTIISIVMGRKNGVLSKQLRNCCVFPDVTFALNSTEYFYGSMEKSCKFLPCLGEEDIVKLALNLTLGQIKKKKKFMNLDMFLFQKRVL